MTLTAGPPEGMSELRSDPIFLSQFLRLALPPIDAVLQGDAGQGRTPEGPAYMPASVGPPPALTDVPTLQPWVSEASGKPFLEDLTTMVANMDEVRLSRRRATAAAHVD